MEKKHDCRKIRVIVQACRLLQIYLVVYLLVQKSNYFLCRSRRGEFMILLMFLKEQDQQKRQQRITYGGGKLLLLLFCTSYLTFYLFTKAWTFASRGNNTLQRSLTNNTKRLKVCIICYSEHHFSNVSSQLLFEYDKLVL